MSTQGSSPDTRGRFEVVYVSGPPHWTPEPTWLPPETAQVSASARLSSDTRLDSDVVDMLVRRLRPVDERGI